MLERGRRHCDFIVVESSQRNVSTPCNVAGNIVYFGDLIQVATNCLAYKRKWNSLGDEIAGDCLRDHTVVKVCQAQINSIISHHPIHLIHPPPVTNSYMTHSRLRDGKGAVRKSRGPSWLRTIKTIKQVLVL